MNTFKSSTHEAGVSVSSWPSRASEPCLKNKNNLTFLDFVFKAGVSYVAHAGLKPEFLPTQQTGHQ